MSRTLFKGDREYFPGIDRIQYEGPGSDNPLAFKAYDANRVVAGKTMEEHFRFAVCYWHTFCGTGADPFGGPTYERPWFQPSDAVEAATQKAKAAL